MDELNQAENLIRNALQLVENHFDCLNNLEIHNNANDEDITFRISWRLPTPTRPNRRSRTICLIIPRERIEDDGLINALQNGMDGFTRFLKTYNPDHETPFNSPPPVEEYIIKY